MKKLKLVENNFDKLKSLSEKSKMCKTIDQLIDVKASLLNMTKYLTMTDREKLNKKVEGIDYLMEIENVVFKKMKDINEESTISDILQSLNDETKTKTKKFRIGILGISGKNNFVINRVINYKI